MKTFLLGFLFFACTLRCSAQFIYTGAYAQSFRHGKEIDSLIIRPDSTCRLVFYFPHDDVREFVDGTWKISGNVLLFADKSGQRYASFKMLLDFANNVYRADLMTGPGYLRKKLRLNKVSGS